MMISSPLRSTYGLTLSPEEGRTEGSRFVEEIIRTVNGLCYNKSDDDDNDDDKFTSKKHLRVNP